MVIARMPTLECPSADGMRIWEERQKRVRIELAPSSWKDRLAFGKLLVE